MNGDGGVTGTLPGHIELAGSGRRAITGAERAGSAPAEGEVTVTIVVRRRAALPPESTSGVPIVIPRAEFAARHGAHPDDLAAVERFADRSGLAVVSADPARRLVIVRGTVARAEAAFGVRLSHYEIGGRAYRGREGSVQIPIELAEIVVAVLGLDDRPQARCSVRRGPTVPVEQLPDPTVDPWPKLTPAATQAAAGPVPLWATQVAELYQFPPDHDGQGETIAIVELGGGYRDEELAAYFAKAQISPAPQVVAVPVGHGANSPTGDPSGPDGEVLLDIEVAGSVAPGASIAVFFADPSDAGFLQAITAAIHDTTHAPSVVSISWGAPESEWTAQSLRAFDEAFADGAALGVTVLAAAGDHGAGDAAGDDKAHTDFPASSPNVVGCGGTTLVGASGRVIRESAWNDGDGWATGGGISATFPEPAWQAVGLPPDVDGATSGGRGVPDVAGNADITTGYLTLVNGQWGPAGGTSAVAPLYAGLVARCNQALGHPVGALNPRLYAANAEPSAAAFRDIVSGDNSVPATDDFGAAVAGYAAGPGWDACTGLGSIHGKGLLDAL
jgi:kumamolisin